jgi:putative ubiquitin-RnfH superfamily antitoxin RatB of RatAB toxin-antitoxin module
MELNETFITIEICDARQDPPKFSKISLKSSINEPITIGDALKQVGIAQNPEDPGISRKGCFGVFGVRQTWDGPIYDGDRLELYAPLRIDPKLARRKKANQRKDAKLQSKARQRALERASK